MRLVFVCGDENHAAGAAYQGLCFQPPNPYPAVAPMLVNEPLRNAVQRFFGSVLLVPTVLEHRMDCST